MRAPYGRLVTVYARPGSSPAATGPVWPHVPAQWRLRRWLAPRRDVLVAPAAARSSSPRWPSRGSPADRPARLRRARRRRLRRAPRRPAGGAAAAHAARLPVHRAGAGPARADAGRAAREPPATGPPDLMLAVLATGLAAEPWAWLAGAPALGAPARRSSARLTPPGSVARSTPSARASTSSSAAWPRRPAPPRRPIRRLGDLGRLAAIVVEHDLDLLVVGRDAPRLDVFGTWPSPASELPVRLVELSSLFEEVFGHVPTAEIDADVVPVPRRSARPLPIAAQAPDRRRRRRAAARDRAAACCRPRAPDPARRRAGAVPRRSGSARAGAASASTSCGLMRLGADASAQWAVPRRSARHAVSAPSCGARTSTSCRSSYNVLRGEMSLVGPRPEQPEFVDRLEEHPALLPAAPPDATRDHGLGAGPLRLRRLGRRVGLEALPRPLLRQAPLGRRRPADPGRDAGDARASRASPSSRPENVAFVLADEG